MTQKRIGEETKTAADTIEFTIPKPAFSLANKSFTPVLVLLLIIGSFFLGSLYTKVQYLEGKGGSAAPQPTAAVQGAQAGAQQPGQPTNDDIKKWAQEIGLDMNKFNSCYDSSKYKAQIDKDTADGKAAGVSGTPSFYVNGHQIVGAVPFSIFQRAIDYELAGGNWETPDASISDLVEGPQPAVAKAVTPVDVGRLPALGNKDAKVVVVEFSDLQCPFCKRFWSDTLPQVKKDYIDSGKVVFYYRHFPLEFHPMAIPFAHASECANEQGKFWQMHDKIYQAQP